MTEIITTIDGVHGDVKIAIDEGKDKQTMELRWCKFDDESTGFLTSFAQAPIIVTDVAAEHLIRMVISGLVRTFQVKPGDLTIINHMGEHLPDVQFLPPTFKGNEADITLLVAQQHSLNRIHSMYEETGVLNSTLIELAREEGVVDDLLSLVQVRASGIFLAVKKPSQ
ncbi:MAG: hypothetical protein ACXABY_01985 [Candidatus Thorarchaeota archaeon]|jgi:hypothetical protein